LAVVMTTANGRGTPQGAHHRLLKGATAPFLDSARSGFVRSAVGTLSSSTASSSKIGCGRTVKLTSQTNSDPCPGPQVTLQGGQLTYELRALKEKGEIETDSGDWAATRIWSSLNGSPTLARPSLERPKEKAAQTPLSAHGGQFGAFKARAQVAEQAAARVRSGILQRVGALILTHANELPDFVLKLLASSRNRPM
jgi:hypothetical protein